MKDLHAPALCVTKWSSPAVHLSLHLSWVLTSLGHADSAWKICSCLSETYWEETAAFMALAWLSGGELLSCWGFQKYGYMAPKGNCSDGKVHLGCSPPLQVTPWVSPPALLCSSKSVSDVERLLKRRDHVPLNLGNWRWLGGVWTTVLTLNFLFVLHEHCFESDSFKLHVVGQELLPDPLLWSRRETPL